MNQAPLRIQFYTTPPIDQNLDLDYVSDLVNQRFQVLQFFHTISQDFGRRKRNADLLYEFSINDLAKILRLPTDHDLSHSVRSDIKKDILSHFFLLTICARYEDMRNWFVQQELGLFKFRFANENNCNKMTISRFLKENRIHLDLATAEEAKRVYSHCKLSDEDDACSIYKVWWVEALEYLRDDEIYLENGWAFFFSGSLVDLLAEKMRAVISRNIAICKKYMKEIIDDERLSNLMSNMHRKYAMEIDKTMLKESSTTAEEYIIADQIKSVSMSFPPCMRNILSSVSKEHHLKHWARMQFGLFLKGIGVPLEESLKFWRDSFKPKCDDVQFDRAYAYNIRHNYGQEGKRANYTPYSCVKIISNNLPNGVDDCHGCPFAHGDVAAVVRQLELNLGGKALNVKVKEGIIQSTKERQFQVSCAYYLRAMHGLPEDEPMIISHPNQYFKESRRILASQQLSKK